MVIRRHSRSAAALVAAQSQRSFQCHPMLSVRFRAKKNSRRVGRHAHGSRQVYCEAFEIGK